MVGTHVCARRGACVYMHVCVYVLFSAMRIQVNPLNMDLKQRKNERKYTQIVIVTVFQIGCMMWHDS